MTATEHGLALIACRARNGVIGLRSRLPWDYSDDMAHFKRVTMGHTLIFGRVTFEALDATLKGRRIVVLSRSCELMPGADAVVHSLNEAIAVARCTDACPIVCGGAEVFAQALPVARRLYLTEIAEDFDGDALFPMLNEREWRETERHVSGDLTFRVLDRLTLPTTKDRQ